MGADPCDGDKGSCHHLELENTLRAERVAQDMPT